MTKFWNKKGLLAGLAAGLALCLCVLSAARAQELYVVTEDFAPYNMVENGEIVGYSTEVLRAVLKRADVGYRIELLPWPRALRIAKYAKDVLVYTVVRTPEREDLFHWIGPIASRTVDMFRLKGRADVIPSGESELINYRVGVVRDDATEALMHRLGFVQGKNLTVLEDQQAVLRLLDAGRIDMAPSNSYSFQYDLVKGGRSPKDYVSCFHFEQEQGGYYFAISRGSNRWLIERISEAYAALEREGILDEIKSRYDPAMVR